MGDRRKRTGTHMMKIGILGLGKMGEALAKGIRASGAKGIEVEATTKSKASATAAARELKISVHTDNKKLLAKNEVIVLCVKPHHAEEAMKSIAGGLTKNHLVISVCASITTEQLEHWSKGKCPVIRAMSNTPAL